MSTVTDFPVIVRQKYEDLNEHDQALFREEYTRKAKSKTKGLLFLILLGFHYLYIRRTGLQIAFWLTGGGLFVWWIIDLFRIGGMVKKYNQEVALQAMRDIITFKQAA